MKLPERSTVIKYTSTIAVAALLAWIYFANQAVEYGPFGEQTQADQLRMICDGFTIPGLLLLLSGLLMSVANEGALDGLGYLGHYMFHMLVPGKRSGTRKYGDYIAEKRQKRVTGYGFLYVVGGVCMAFALVFYVLYKLNA